MREQLISQGYLVIRKFQDPEFIKEVEKENAFLLERQKNFFDTIGIDWTTDVNYHLIYNEKIVKLMKDLEFSSPKFTGATFVNKKPFEPARPWHQDWWAWTHKFSDPPQVGILYYMTKTTVENGCLRVLPGSHKFYHAVHGNYHDSNYTLKNYEKEVKIELDPGDVVMIDTRLLHSTCANKTSQNRMGINVWYVPDFDKMPESIKKHLSHATAIKEMGNFLPMHSNPAKLDLVKEDYLPSLNKLKKLLF